jgi:hypothetical protein
VSEKFEFIDAQKANFPIAGDVRVDRGIYIGIL